MNLKECFKKLRIWRKSAAGKVSLCLIVASLVLIIWGKFPQGVLSEKELANRNSIIFGVATNLIGIVITISFVQYFLDQQRNKDMQNEEAKKILRQDRIMQILIDRYIAYYNQLTTPHDTIIGNSYFDSEQLNLSFDFPDLRGLYQCSLFLRDRPYTPVIVSFYEVELTLRDYCITILRDIDFRFFPEIREILLEFVRKSISLDVRNAVLAYIPRSIENQEVSEMIAKYIVDDTNNWVGRYHSGELNSNIMIPFVMLYDMLKSEGELISKYREEIKTVNIV